MSNPTSIHAEAGVGFVLQPQPDFSPSSFAPVSAAVVVSSSAAITLIMIVSPSEWNE